MTDANCNLGPVIWKSLGDPETDIGKSWLACVFVVLSTYVVSLMSGNYSQVDKIWSIVPFVYAWILVVPGDPRTLLMAGLATLWGLRLTYNFNRRGGYHWPPWTGDEDYRWAYLQRGFYLPFLKNRFYWHLFNFVFISLYQNLLLLLITAPSMVANLVANNHNDCFLNENDNELFEWNPWDGVASLLLLLFLALETMGDNAQHAFQTEKYRRKNAGEPLEGDYAAGYCRSGLYAWIRKPNYTGEQGIWCAYYLFSVASLNGASWSDRIFNCSLLGPVMLLSLFQGSGHMTECITISKYPSYVQYQERVPLYLPFFLWGGSGSEKSKDS